MRCGFCFIKKVEKIERTKFNVDKNNEKRTCNGIVFDSVLEMKYYRDVVLPKVESGEIKYFELQKKYILQEGFVYNNSKILPIMYVADFYIEYSNGKSIVIDIKGCPDTTAKLKRKLFWHKYPDIDYQWITYIKKFGGWGNYDEYNKIRKRIKREQKYISETKEDMRDEQLQTEL